MSPHQDGKIPLDRFAAILEVICCIVEGLSSRRPIIVVVIKFIIIFVIIIIAIKTIITNRATLFGKSQSLRA